MSQIYPLLCTAKTILSANVWTNSISCTELILTRKKLAHLSEHHLASILLAEIKANSLENQAIYARYVRFVVTWIHKGFSE